MRVQLKIKTQMGRMYSRPSNLAIPVPQPLEGENQQQYMQRLEAFSQEMREKNTRIVQIPVYMTLEADLPEESVQMLEDNTAPPEIDPLEFPESTPWQLPNGLICTGMEVVRLPDPQDLREKLLETQNGEDGS